MSQVSCSTENSHQDLPSIFKQYLTLRSEIFSSNFYYSVMLRSEMSIPFSNILSSLLLRSKIFASAFQHNYCTIIDAQLQDLLFNFPTFCLTKDHSPPPPFFEEPPVVETTPLRRCPPHPLPSSSSASLKTFSTLLQPFLLRRPPPQEGGLFCFFWRGGGALLKTPATLLRRSHPP